MVDLDGTVTLMTGASRGIGAAAAREIVAADLAAELVAELGVERAVALQADFDEETSADRLWGETVQWGGRVDVLVNNAGVYEPAPVDAPLEEWRASWGRTLRINLTAPATLSKHAVEHFRAHGGGAIVNVGSRGSFRGDGGDYQHYAATKGGLVAITRTIAKNHAAEGVVAYHVAPGWVADTELTRRHIEEHGYAEIGAQLPLGEMAPVEEVARLITFLASGAARHMSGGTIDINGASYTH
jgi:NAD(P)-dependent dehydrogenase (short-subunit alcohol dehydrogenase family)